MRCSNGGEAERDPVPPCFLGRSAPGSSATLPRAVPGYHALSHRQGRLRRRCAVPPGSLTASLYGHGFRLAKRPSRKSTGPAAPTGTAITTHAVGRFLMVKNPYARAWTLDSIDRNQEYILYFDAVRKRWELRTLQDGAYVQTRAMVRRPGRTAERPLRAKPKDPRRSDSRSTLVPMTGQQSLTFPDPRPSATLEIAASSSLGLPRPAVDGASDGPEPAGPTHHAA